MPVSMPQGPDLLRALADGFGLATLPVPPELGTTTHRADLQIALWALADDVEAAAKAHDDAEALEARAENAEAALKEIIEDVDAFVDAAADALDVEAVWEEVEALQYALKAARRALGSA